MDGLVCEECGAAYWKVLKTKRLRDALARRRKCRECGFRITTIEKIKESSSQGATGAPHQEKDTGKVAH